MRNTMPIAREDIEALRREKYNGQLDANMHDDLARLARGEPVAYIIGSQPFLGVDVLLNSRPLIPRPETEWWTEELIIQLKTKDSTVSVLDMCAGSGAIGLALLKHLPSVHVSFSDIVPEHILDIQASIVRNALDGSRATLRDGDLFAPYPHTQFDVVVANPPYIPNTRLLPKSVAGYEPSTALFAGTDGLSVITRILAETPKHIKQGGMLWLECDSEHAPQVLTLAKLQAKHAQIRTDHYGRPRLLVAYYEQ